MWPRREPKHDGAVFPGEEVGEEEETAEEDDEGAGARHPRPRGVHLVRVLVSLKVISKTNLNILCDVYHNDGSDSLRSHTLVVRDDGIELRLCKNVAGE